MNWHSFFFYGIGLAACLLALAVVVSNNIVRMAFYLVLCLGAVAGLFFLAGADFLGALQLMVYVGGTLVLLIFGVMLTARGPGDNLDTPPAQWLLAGLVGIALLGALAYAALNVGRWFYGGIGAGRSALPVRPTTEQLGLGLLGVRVDRLDSDPASQPLQAGKSGYLLAFEVVSVHLVVVLVGAAYLARARRRTPRSPPGEPGSG